MYNDRISVTINSGSHYDLSDLSRHFCPPLLSLNLKRLLSPHTLRDSIIMILLVLHLLSDLTTELRDLLRAPWLRLTPP